jgi:outer membrane protein OmpA-like peptidoglycan-associated protein
MNFEIYRISKTGRCFQQNGTVRMACASVLVLFFSISWSFAFAGAVGISCDRPVVFSHSDVNIGVIPFTTDAPDSDFVYKKNTNDFDHNPVAVRLARVIQLDTLFSLRYPAGMGVVHFQGNPESCQADEVVDRILGSRESVTLGNGKGLVMYWGRFLNTGDSLYAQSYLSFFRRGAGETITLDLNPGENALRFSADLSRRALPFAARLLSRADLKTIDEGFDRASIIWEDDSSDKRVGQLPENPEQPFAFSVTKVNDFSGRMYIDPYRDTGLPEGWVDARVDPKVWPLRANLPELSFINALAGYLAFRVIESERPEPNWAGKWPSRLAAARDRAAVAFGDYRRHAVLRVKAEIENTASTQSAEFVIDSVPLKQLRSGGLKAKVPFVVPAAERTALAWSHGLVAAMDLLLASEDQIPSDRRKLAASSAKSQIERAIAYVPNDPGLLNLASLVELRDCCLDGQLRKAVSAEKFLRTALTADPGHRGTVQNLARLYAALEPDDLDAFKLNVEQLARRRATLERLESHMREKLLDSNEPVATIYFPSGSNIDEVVRKDILHLTTLFREYQASKVELHGYSDPSGSADANLALSRDRVDAVRRVLEKAKISPGSISGVGHGETDPKGDSLNLKASQRRRVEIFLR